MKKSLLLIMALLGVIACNVNAQLPASISVERHAGTGDYDGTDSITIMVTFADACTPAGKESVELLNEICVHGAAVAIDAADNTWGTWGIDWNGTPGDGSTPTFDSVENGFKKGMVPNKYFVVPEGSATRGMSFVFNGCDSWASELKDDTDGDGTCNDFYIYWVDVPEYVGVKTITLSDVIVYPNPAGDYIQVASAFRSLRVYDITGKVIINLNTPSRSAQYQLDISSLQSGIYLVAIEDLNGGKSNTKFSKK